MNNKEIEHSKIAILSFDLSLAMDQYAPYKTESKTTLAERAKALGLEDITLKILAGDDSRPSLDAFVNKSVEGLESVEKVKEGIRHIIAQIFSKDIAVLETISEM